MSTATLDLCGKKYAMLQIQNAYERDCNLD